MRIAMLSTSRYLEPLVQLPILDARNLRLGIIDS